MKQISWMTIAKEFLESDAQTLSGYAEYKVIEALVLRLELYVKVTKNLCAALDKEKLSTYERLYLQEAFDLLVDDGGESK